MKILESNQDKLSAAVVLDDKLDYNERMIYQILLTASVCTIFMLHILCLVYDVVFCLHVLDTSHIDNNDRGHL